MSDELQTLGWREWVAFPALGIKRVKAKIDTGARTTALHAFRVEPFERDGKLWVNFALHPRHRNQDEVIECEAPVLAQRVVRDSGGHEEMRYVIETVLRIGSKDLTVEATLTARDNMLFRVLVGRTALEGRYVVDPARSYLISKKRSSGAPGVVHEV